MKIKTLNPKQVAELKMLIQMNSEVINLLEQKAEQHELLQETKNTIEMLEANNDVNVLIMKGNILMSANKEQVINDLKDLCERLENTITSIEAQLRFKYDNFMEYARKSAKVINSILDL